MEYLRVANNKISQLIKRHDFRGIIDSTGDSVTLKFKNDECTIDKFGKVIWIGKES